MKLGKNTVSLMRLIQRSPDRGAGWRTCTPATYTLFKGFPHPELLELDAVNLQVRFTERGNILLDYM